MKKLKHIQLQIFSTLLLFLSITQSITAQYSSCSTVSLTSADTTIFGRNHDAILKNCLIVFNPRSIYKKGFEFAGENNPKWVSKYSSITFNVLGVGFAVCGMNEKGLAIGHMGFSEAKYQPKDDRPVVDQIQFITYILDNCSKTSEVVSIAEKIRISDESTTREHYFVCDAKGNTAILEHIEGKLVVYTNETMPYPILSNDNYEKSLKYLENYQGFGGSTLIPEKNYGVEEIMAIGCTYIKNYNPLKNSNIINSSFELLENIGFNKYPPPSDSNVDKNYGTQFTTVFDLKNLTIYYRTKSNRNIKIIDFNKFNPDCVESMKILEAEEPATGNVNGLFTTYSLEKNIRFVYSRLQNVDGMSKEVLDFLASYPESYKCNRKR